MSATVTKATRRDLRRAVGADALKMVEDHEQGLLGHAMTLKHHDRLLQLGHDAREALRAEFAQRSDALEAELRTLRALFEGKGPDAEG